ncbi:MAG: hypothetical protein ACI9NT_002226 [Bacteroidia bacterium]|jgi:hypothetical protein
MTQDNMTSLFTTLFRRVLACGLLLLLGLLTACSDGSDSIDPGGE